MMNLSQLPFIIDDSVSAIWRTMLAEHESASVVAAIKFNLFDLLEKEGPLTLSELKDRAGLGQRGAEVVITVLHGLGYIVSDSNAKYSNASVASNFLFSKSPFYWGPMLTRASKTAVRLVKELEADASLLHRNETKLKNWEEGSLDDLEETKYFAAAMQSHSLIPAMALAKKVNLEREFGIKKFLDIGGGSGIFSVSLVSQQPNLQAIIIELPLASTVAQSYIDSYSDIRPGSVTTHTMNMFKDPFPPAQELGYEGAFLSNVLHDWDMDQCSFLLRKIYDALPHGGVILIHEALLHERCVTTGGPLLTALFSIHMFLNTKGKQFTFSELKEILEKVGFKNVYSQPTHGIYSLISGKK